MDDKIILASQLKKQDLRDCAWVQERIKDNGICIRNFFVYIFAGYAYWHGNFEK
jgi:hypothetical protein